MRTTSLYISIMLNLAVYLSKNICQYSTTILQPRNIASDFNPSRMNSPFKPKFFRQVSTNSSTPCSNISPAVSLHMKSTCLFTDTSSFLHISDQENGDDLIPKIGHSYMIVSLLLATPVSAYSTVVSIASQDPWLRLASPRPPSICNIYRRFVPEFRSTLLHITWQSLMSAYVCQALARSGDEESVLAL